MMGDTADSNDPHAIALMASHSRLKSLNFDIFAAMIPWIRNRKDLYSFVTTCSDLYNISAPALLSFHYRIGTRSLRGLYDFLVSKSPTSFTALRSLDLYFSRYPVMDQYPEEHSVRMLNDILTRAQNLQHLEVHGDILYNNPSLYQTLGSLRSLKTLSLPPCSGPGNGQQTMITQLQSPLTKLNYDNVLDANMDPISLLANFRHTLEELAFSVGNISYGPNLTRDMSYPKLVNLKLSGIQDPPLSTLIPAFPNLQTLDIQASGSYNDNDTRKKNIRFQANYPSQRWYLVSLTGDVRSLFVLGLQCRVPKLTIANFDTEMDWELEEILPPLRPLHLSFEGCIVETKWLSEAIESVWHGLKRLDLRVEYPATVEAYYKHEERFDDLFNNLNLVSILRPGLSVITITLRGESDFMGIPSFSHESASSCDFLDGLRMDVLATRAIQAIPSLQMATFIITTESTRASYWMRREEDQDLWPHEETSFLQELEGTMADLFEVYQQFENPGAGGTGGAHWSFSDMVI